MDGLREIFQGLRIPAWKGTAKKHDGLEMLMAPFQNADGQVVVLFIRSMQIRALLGFMRPEGGPPNLKSLTICSTSSIQSSSSPR